MASKWFVGAMAILAFVLPVVAMATEFTVGDDQRWTINFDYEAWAKEKIFHVGDKLGNRDAQCLQSEWYDLHELHYTTANEAITTGNDKLVITVLEESMSPAPAPSNPTAPAPNSTHGISRSGYQLLMAAMVALAFLAI
ncbi:hypothetical protein CK203_098576 [Vitis vinifera]|uniref:Phytocyanin domain-containing protein n=1 Tax=Vitis vinifera TaxID=29760 RepID=A0A438BMG5_VITVI|nr:hypothetical protein CK203_098576 [Vitis vinifera]